MRYLFTLYILICLMQADVVLYKNELIFPLQNKHCHGSSLIVLEDQSLLVCWFYGSGERKADDVVIMASHQKDGKWGKPFVLADTPGFPDCNPALSVGPRGKIWLFWTVILDNHWQSGLLKYRYGTWKNDKISWEWQNNIHIKPLAGFNKKLQEYLPEFEKKYPNMVPNLQEKKLADLSADEEMYYYIKKKGSNKLQQRLGWMTRLHPLWLPSGKMLLPLYTDAYSVSIIAITDDYGKHWTASHPIVGYGNIQPSLILKKDKSIVAMMRENGPEYRIRISNSKDKGITWGKVTNMSLVNPGSSIECISLANGNWVLVHNDTIDGRHQLKISLSEDEGETWPWSRYLEKENSGSFSYPSVAEGKNENIHITYSYHLKNSKKKQKSIKYTVINQRWIKNE